MPHTIETIPLSTGLLRNMLVKAQKDARGFQNTLLGECSHGSEAERKRQAYGFAEILNHASARVLRLIVRQSSRTWICRSRISRIEPH